MFWKSSVKFSQKYFSVSVFDVNFITRVNEGQEISIKMKAKIFIEIPFVFLMEIFAKMNFSQKFWLQFSFPYWNSFWKKLFQYFYDN